MTPDTLSIPPQGGAIASLRDTLFEDTASLEEYAAATGKSTRTVQREIARGDLSVVYNGRRPRIVVSAARDKLMAGAKARHQPVRRGRPAKQAKG
jgi:hypothetical protein